jgi:cytoskeleton protein RodZ
VSDAPAAAPSRLAAAREARGLSPAQVAQQMRITAEAVQAMEEGRYADLGPSVFARGHLRKYAALLGVPAEDVLADYEASPSHVAESTLIPPASAHTPVRGGDRPAATRAAAVVAALAVLAAAAGAGWWFWQARVDPVPGATVASDVADGPPGGPAAIEEASPEGVAGPAAAADGAADAATGPVAGGLSLAFSGPCWTEVYDADGQRLAFQLAEAGSTLAFDGPGPWRVVLGNADSVRLTLDGAALEIPATMKVRDAALVTIAGDGTVAPAPAAEDRP